MPKVHDLTIRNIGAIGIITDIPPHELPANAWTSAQNCRFRDKRVERIGGNTDVMPDHPEEPKGMTFFKDTWHWGGDLKLYEYLPGNGHAIRYTDTNLLSDRERWTFTEFSGVLIASHPNTDPVYWNGVTASASAYEVLPGWGEHEGGTVTWRTKKIRTFKNQLIALNMQEDGVDYPQRIRFSDIAQPNVPPDEWETKTTNSAGFIDLSNATSEIIDGYVLGNSFIIYTKHEVYVMDFIGGNEVYSVRQVFNDGGVLMEGCIASFNNNHLVVAADDIYVHNGSTKQSVIDGKIKDKLFASVAAIEFQIAGAYKPRIEAVTYKALNEIWIFFTTSPETDGSQRAYFKQAAIWNYQTGAWSYTQVPDLIDLTISGLPIDDVLRWNNADTWDPEKPNMTWDNSSPLIWDFGGKDIEQKILIGCGKTGFIALDQNVSGATRNIPFSLERRKIDLDEEMPHIPFRIQKTLLSIYPEFQGSGRVSIAVGYSYTPNEDPTWGAPVEFDIETDVKADFRVTGRYFSVRITSLDDSDWDFEGWLWRVGGMTQQR